MKKLLAILLESIMALSLVACSDTEKPDDMRQEFYDIVEKALNDIELCLDEKMSPNRLGERLDEYYKEMEEIDESKDTAEEMFIRSNFNRTSLRDKDEENELYQVEAFKEEIIHDLNFFD